MLFTVFMDEVVETYLPTTAKIEPFFTLPTNDKIKVIELGLAFFENGIQKVQGWDNEQFAEKIQSLTEKYESEKKGLLNNIVQNDEMHSTYCQEAKKRQQLLIQEIESSQKLYYSVEISHIKGENSALLQKITALNSQYQELHASLDDKYNDRQKESQGFYEAKLTDLQTRMDTMREDYDVRLNDHIVRAQKATFKGQDGEEFIFNQLNLLFPKAEIEDTHSIPGRGDFIMRENEFVMMIENKNYNKNVQKSEIDKFYRDIDSSANNDIQCAVLVSLHSGICCKDDFEFEVRNNKPILFLHNLQTNLYNLKLAVKFFTLLLDEKNIDLSNKEMVDSFKNVSKTIKRNFNKQRSKLDKYHSDQMECITSQEANLISLYKLLKINY